LESTTIRITREGYSNAYIAGISLFMELLVITTKGAKITLAVVASGRCELPEYLILKRYYVLLGAERP
jgi:hypothetical protein